MTAKDKKLLTIAAAALIVIAIIVVGIKPTFDKYQEIRAEKAELKAQKVQMQKEIENISTYQVSYDNALNNYKETANHVFGDLDNSGIQDATVNEFVVKNGLTITDFVITSVENIGISSYEIVADDSGKKIGSSSLTSGNSVTKAANITISVSGAKENILNLLDMMNGDEGISVRQTSFSLYDEGTSASISFLMILS